MPKILENNQVLNQKGELHGPATKAGKQKPPQASKTRQAEATTGQPAIPSSSAARSKKQQKIKKWKIQN